MTRPRAFVPAPPRLDVDTPAAVAAWRTLAEALVATDPPCRDDVRFTADDASAADLAHMGALCRSCPIRRACEGYAVAMPRVLASGFWAGETRGSKLRASGPRKRASDAA